MRRVVGADRARRLAHEYGDQFLLRIDPEKGARIGVPAALS